MAKYWFKSNIFARLSEILEADSEKEVMNKIRNQKSFEIKQEVLKVYPSSIEITKNKDDQKKEKQMTSTELIKDMLERQKAYDAEVFKKHNVDYISKSQLESALFDELGELMHAQKSDWCWWKFTQEPKDEANVFEEYIDVVHFALMYEIKFGTGCYQDEDIKWNYNKLKTDLGFGQAYAFSCVISLTRDDNVLAYVLALGLHLGYSLEEIYKEYVRKNEINKERLAKGY